MQDRGEYRITVWGVAGNLSAALRTRAAGATEFVYRASGSNFKTREAAEKEMREKLPREWR